MNILGNIIEFIRLLFIKNSKNNELVVEKNSDSNTTNVFSIDKTNDFLKNEEDNNMNQEIKIENVPVSSVTKKQYNGLVVVLDPGHAITTSGKKSPYSLKKVSTPELPFEEWEFNREITYILKPMLKEYGIDVFVTTNAERDGDSDLGLSKRAARANEYVKKSGKKGLFISIHSDADGMGDKWTNARGWSCFTTKGQNNSDIFADCLYDAAESIFPKLGLKIRTDKRDGDRDWESDFTVILKANMPAVLTENFFYTNIEDLKFLSSDEGKKMIANVHLLGILRFADMIYKM